VTNEAFSFDRRTLPTESRWALEANAGTGKTWTIQQLVTHCLADPTLAPSEIVVVTFTRSAAAELRSRIRGAVAEAAAGASGTPGPLEYSPKERARLRRAVGNIAQLRVTTIHRFAQQALATLGVPVGKLSDEASSTSFVEGTLNDVIRTFDQSTLAALQLGDPTFRTRALEALTVLANNPGALAFASLPGPVDALLIDLILKTRTALEEKKRLLGLASYDDLLTNLASRLEVDENCRRIASTIKVLLIDEFQDTDGLQWEIFDRLAQAGHLKMFVTVGDPKQAIYGFRGGDVQVYREAVDENARTLRKNYRSSQELLDANNAFFEGASFGSELSRTIVDGIEIEPARISYQEVEAAGPFSEYPMSPSWEFRLVGSGTAPIIKRAISRDLVAYINSVVGHDEIPSISGTERVVDGVRLATYSDLCILVTSNLLGKQLAKDLQLAGIPATMLGGANVFSSEAATQWTYVLEALADPSNPSSARLLALSWFGGEPASVASELRDDDQWLTRWVQRIARWREQFFFDRASFFTTVLEESGVREHLANFEMAERNLTDLDHIAEILRTRTNDDLELLISYMVAASPDGDGESSENPDLGGAEWARRIERDTSAVKIMTVHRAKGLEFPIVLLPYLSAPRTSTKSIKAYRVKKDGQPITVVDLTTKSGTPGFDVKKALDAAEIYRKGYVAFTRAEFRNVAWTWEPASTNTPLFKNQQERLQLVAKYPTLFTASDASDPSSPVVTPPSVEHVPRPIARAEFSRLLDQPDERYSFTEFTRKLSHRSSMISSDEGDAPTRGDFEPTTSEGELDEAGDPFVTVRSSKYIGVAVHRVLQHVDLARPDRRQAIEEQLQEAALHGGLHLTEDDFDQLVQLVERCLESNLGAIANHQRLDAFGAGSLLPEFGFDFLVCDRGDHERVRVARMEELLQLLRTYLGDDPTYSSWLTSLSVFDTELSGMLTGSIDAVLGWEEGGTARFVITDYKTNLLKDEHSRERYNKPQLIAAMDEHHYQLQAILYLVALHRYLRSRIAGYDYDRNIAGATYLFLRGMQPSTHGSGVVAMTPPKELIEKISNLFDGGHHD
jgi:exodeoxyribonuclease V beta subunit